MRGLFVGDRLSEVVHAALQRAELALADRTFKRGFWPTIVPSVHSPASNSPGPTGRIHCCPPTFVRRCQPVSSFRTYRVRIDRTSRYRIAGTIPSMKRDAASEPGAPLAAGVSTMAPWISTF